MKNDKPNNSFSLYARNEMAVRGDKIREWAAQNENLLLKKCAKAILEAI